MVAGGFGSDVQEVRRRFDGPSTFSLEDSATGFEVINNAIPNGAKTHRVLVTVPADAQAADLHALRMVGTADHEGRQLSSVVSTTALIRARKPVLSYPPSWIDGLLMVATAPEAAAFFETKLSGDKVAFARDKGLAELTVTLERKNKDFKAAITVVVEGLAAPFSYAVKQDKDSYKITIKGPKDAAAQSHALRIIGYGALKGKGQVVIKEAALAVAASAGVCPIR